MTKIDDVREAVAGYIGEELHRLQTSDTPMGRLEMLDCLAHAAFAALEARGLCIVPVEPTDEMLIASQGWREYDVPDHWPNDARYPYGVYRAMLAARGEG